MLVKGRCRRILDGVFREHRAEVVRDANMYRNILRVAVLQIIICRRDRDHAARIGIISAFGLITLLLRFLQRCISGVPSTLRCLGILSLLHLLVLREQPSACLFPKRDTLFQPLAAEQIFLCSIENRCCVFDFVLLCRCILVGCDTLAVLSRRKQTVEQGLRRFLCLYIVIPRYRSIARILRQQTLQRFVQLGRIRLRGRNQFGDCILQIRKCPCDTLFRSRTGF